jgi:hypothetical protein
VNILSGNATDKRAIFRLVDQIEMALYTRDCAIYELHRDYDKTADQLARVAELSPTAVEQVIAVMAELDEQD